MDTEIIIHDEAERIDELIEWLDQEPDAETECLLLEDLRFFGLHVPTCRWQID